MNDNTQPVSARLATFIAGFGPELLSAGVRHEAKRSLLNFLACALGVAHDPAVGTAVALLKTLSGPAQASLIGRPERLDILNAAFVNAIAANLLDYDDTHLNTVIHPTAPIAPAVLALAEAQGHSGQEVLRAFALGAEVTCRIGNAVSPGHYDRGWHITATCGVFGAAAGAARLLNLSPDETAHALGIAAGQSAGLVENLASGAKNVGVGNAARNGLFAALMAKAGYTAAATAIEGPLGWARAAGNVPKLDQLFDGLGATWEMQKNTYKPYPSGIVIHAVIDACLELRERFEIKPEDVAAITVTGDALLLARGDRAVNNVRDARVSIHHAVAAALIRARAGVGEFEDAFVFDPAVVKLRGKVEAIEATDMARGAARVAIRKTSGAMHETVVRHPRGSLERPLNDGEIEAKIREMAALGGVAADVERLTNTVWNIESLDDVSPLMRLAAG